MISNIKLLLFAHPRSGSTTLMQVLNLHSEVNLMHEPFNEDREEWAEGNQNYVDKVKTVEDLERALKDVHESYCGFKHLSYQLPTNLTKHLLTNEGYRIIFLNRKNYLKTSVSALVAEQTGVWISEEKEQMERLETLQPLDIEKVREKIDHFKNEIDRYKSVALEARVQIHEVSYEELFAESENTRVEVVIKTFSFLGLEFPHDRLADIKQLLSPKRKVTSEKMYNLIPNIQEVEKECGSEENGFLFSDH